MNSRMSTPAAQDEKAGFIYRQFCPCCGSPVETSKPKASAPICAEDIPPDEHGKFLSGYTSERTFFSYVECKKCTMVYCPIFYDEAMLAQLYEHQPENMAEAPFETRKKTQIGYVDLLPKELPVAGDFLEIGADIGLFAAECASRYDLNHFTLYEPNIDVHSVIRANLPEHELTIREGLFPSDSQEDNGAALAVMIHVLDHIVDPTAVLADLYKAMAPGGVALIVTHDVNSMLSKILGRRWPPFTLQHPHLFSPKTMQAMLERAGFCDVKVKKSVNYFPVSYLMHAGLSVFGIQKQIFPQWPTLSVGMRLGNIATVAFKPHE